MDINMKYKIIYSIPCYNGYCCDTPADNGELGFGTPAELRSGCDAPRDRLAGRADALAD
jgi:hypothetical protein